MDWSKLFLDFAEAISPALQVFLQTALVALASAGAAWVAKKFQTEKTKLSQEQQYLVSTVAGVAVKAVEQMYKSYDGDAKKAAALEIAEKTLAGYGVVLDLDVLSAAIESEVLNQFNSGDAMSLLSKG
jgi:hypothetical protein